MPARRDTCSFFRHVAAAIKYIIDAAKSALPSHTNNARRKGAASFILNAFRGTTLHHGTATKYRIEHGAGHARDRTRPHASALEPIIRSTLLRGPLLTRALCTKASTQSWSEEWAKAGLGADASSAGDVLNRVMFVQVGFGCDQHGDRRLGSTKAAVRAVRNALEFNSIPGMVHAVPGGRKNMLIHLKLGVPAEAPTVDLDAVAAVFPYGRL